MQRFSLVEKCRVGAEREGTFLNIVYFLALFCSFPSLYDRHIVIRAPLVHPLISDGLHQGVSDVVCVHEVIKNPDLLQSGGGAPGLWAVTRAIPFVMVTGRRRQGLRR